MNPELHLFVGDLHVPFEDPLCWNLILNFVKKEKPGTIHIMGDFMDCYMISSHDKDPTRASSFQSECTIVKAMLDELRQAAPDAKIHYSEGNHENRLPRLIEKKVPELAGLLTIPKCLDFKTLHIKWHPITTPYKVGKLWVKHGTVIRAHSAYTARAELQRVGGSVIHGHTHRLGSHYVSDYNREMVAFENGCLCSTDPTVMDYTKGPPNWQQGFSVAQFHRGLFQMEQVKIIRPTRKTAGYIFHGKWHETSVGD